MDTQALLYAVCNCILSVEIHLRAGSVRGFDGRYLLSRYVLQELSADLCRGSQQSLCTVSTYCLCGTAFCADMLTVEIERRVGHIETEGRAGAGHATKYRPAVGSRCAPRIFRLGEGGGCTLKLYGIYV